MDKLEKAIKDLNEIKSKIIPVLSRMYGSGFSSVFACEKVEEKIDNALELLKEKQPKKGCWEENNDRNFQCSECGNESLSFDDVYVYGMKLENFCPNCGAKADWFCENERKING